MTLTRRFRHDAPRTAPSCHRTIYLPIVFWQLSINVYRYTAFLTPLTLRCVTR